MKMTFKEYLSMQTGIPLSAMVRVADLGRGLVGQNIGDGNLEKAVELSKGVEDYNGVDRGSFYLSKRRDTSSEKFFGLYEVVRREFLRYHQNNGFSVEVENLTTGTIEVRMRKGDDDICGTVIFVNESGVICVGLIDMKCSSEEEINKRRR